MDLDEEEADYVKTIGLLSYKPIIYVANVSCDWRCRCGSR